MKKRFFLLSLLASLSLTGCDVLDKFFDEGLPTEAEENKEPAEQVQEGTSQEGQTTNPEESQTTNPEEGQTTNPEEGTSTGTEEGGPSTSGNQETQQELSADVNEYYKGISTTASGDALKSQLYNLIKGHEKYAYKSLEVAMKVTDRDYELDPVQPNESDDYDPYMRLLYADYNGDKSTAKKWSTSQGSYGTQTNYVWNKEHIWAKSNGFDEAKSCSAYSDLHHLRASDWKCNNTRSNYPFGVVSTHNSSTASYDYTQSRKTDNYMQNKLFEPRDSDKGDVARALFYMATRYSDAKGTDSGNTQLSLTTGTDSTNGKFGYLTTLLQWHEQDKPDKFEINRNGLVQSIQGNRNPYIDHPEWAAKVFG